MEDDRVDTKLADQPYLRGAGGISGGFGSAVSRPGGIAGDHPVPPQADGSGDPPIGAEALDSALRHAPKLSRLPNLHILIQLFIGRYHKKAPFLRQRNNPSLDAGYYISPNV